MSQELRQPGGTFERVLAVPSLCSEPKEVCMSVAKVIEISASSPKSFEDAIRSGIERASSTVEGVMGAWIKEQHAVIEKGKITEFRVIMKVTFTLR
jgi:dodecin